MPNDSVSPMAYRTASIIFSTAHLYHQRQWTTEKNQQEFGACFSAYGHGHNYRLVLTHRDGIARELLASLTHPYDHQHLNFVHPAFQSGELIPTTENIALGLFQSAQTLSSNILGLRLYELDTLWADCGLSLPFLIDRVLPEQVRTAARLPWPELYQTDVLSSAAAVDQVSQFLQQASTYPSWKEMLTDWNVRYSAKLDPIALHSKMGEYYFVTAG